VISRLDQQPLDSHSAHDVPTSRTRIKASTCGCAISGKSSRPTTLVQQRAARIDALEPIQP
jgi:hypothetical protein